jgi:uncharacterized protein with PIN domain
MRLWIAPHLAFLVQWLRVLGVDTRLWDKGVTLGSEEEIVVQWVTYPLPIKEINVKILTLASSSREALLREFFGILGIQPNLSQMFKRCLRCNGLLVPLNHEEAQKRRPDIPDYVLRTQGHFNWCDQCGKVYWAGTHVRNMIRTLLDWGLIAHNPSDPL